MTSSADSTVVFRSARALAASDSRSFYKELYAYKPAEVTLPPGGIGNINFPAPGGAGALSSPFPMKPSVEPSPLAVPPPPPSPTPAPKADSAAKELLLDLQKGDAPKAKAEPKKGDLPDDLFAPGGDAKAKPSK